MKIGVLLLNFGEPENPTLEEVIPFLERIFTLNAPLMGTPSPTTEEVRARSRQLAEERAPGLIAEYEEIGGSPLHRQARDQAEALEAELRRRGHDVISLLGMQFTDPAIPAALERARESGVEYLVPLPVYPLSGPSTTVASLEAVDRGLREMGWDVPSRQIAGWHRHPLYLGMRIAAIERVLEENGLSLADPGTKLVFSAHGTPMKYIEAGNRYDEYVREFCEIVADRLGAPDYALGYQNHTNRPGVVWTQPDIETVIAEIDAERVIVDPISFMHEQSETLAELDHELREEAEERGLGFYRVPIDHVQPDFITCLADLVEAVLPNELGGQAGNESGAAGGKLERIELGQCRCKPTVGTVCTNSPSLG